MIKIKLENPNKNEDGKWFDLMVGNGTKKAFDHLYSNLREIYNSDTDCVITDIESDWAKLDEYTSLDDVVETVRVLITMLDEELKLFKAINNAAVHEPLDIAKKVRYSEMKYIEDVCEEDEVWEIVFFEEEDREIAILY